MDEQGSRGALITIGKAREILGVSRTTMARLVKEGRFTLYQNPLDRRQKLVDSNEVQELATPVPFEAMPEALQPAEPASTNGSNEPPVVELPVEVEVVPMQPTPLPGDPNEEPSLRLLIVLAEAEHAVSESAFVLTSHGEIIHGGLPRGRIVADLTDVDELLNAGYIRVLPGVRRRLQTGAVGREFVLTPAVLETMRHLGGD